MTHSIVYIGDNSHILRLVGLVDETGEPQESATVQVTAIQRHNLNTNVPGISLPITLNHVSGGNYEGQLSHEADFSRGVYIATFVAESDGLHAEWRETLIAVARKK